MRTRLFSLIALLALIFTRPASAQTVIGAAGGDIKNAVFDMLDVWTSPFRATGRDWLSAGGAVALAAAVSPLDAPVDRFVAARPNSALWSSFKELRQGGAIFSGQTITPVAVGLWATGLAFNNRSIRDGVMGCGASYAASSVVRTEVVYRIFQRERPDSSLTHVTVAPPPKNGDQYNFQWGPGPWGMQATPGGHIANVAACAAFLSSRFKLGYAKPLLYVVVAAVGVARAADRAHWTSDQVLGVLFGYAVGREVGHRSLLRAHPARADSSATPTPGSLPPPEHSFFMAPAPGGVAVGWRSTF